MGAVNVDKVSEATTETREYRSTLMEYDGIIGLGMTFYENEPCIQVFVIEGMGKDIEDDIPDKFKDYDIYYTEIGDVRSQR